MILKSGLLFFFFWDSGTPELIIMFIESEFWENWAGRTTKWVHKSEMTICIDDGREDRADQAGDVIRQRQKITNTR